MIKVAFIIIVCLTIFACEDKSSNLQAWEIGGKHHMSKVIFEREQPANVKICSDKYKNIGFPVYVNIDYDGNTYYGLIEGLCITVNAKKIRVRFATPSSGKRAQGTYEILR